MNNREGRIEKWLDDMERTANDSKSEKLYFMSQTKLLILKRNLEKTIYQEKNAKNF